MRALKVLKEKRGISELMSMLILLSLALVGGAVAYGVLTSMSGTIAAKADVQVQSSDIVVTSTKTIVSVTVKNIGTIGIDSCTVTVYNDAGTAVQISIGAIPVGQTKSAENTAATGFTEGKEYPASLAATAGTQTVNKSWTILAR